MSQALVRYGFLLMALVFGVVGAAAQTRIPMPDEVFDLRVTRSSDGSVLLDWSIAPETYLYRDKISVTSSSGDRKPLNIETSPGKLKDDPTFGETEVYYGSARATVSADALGTAGAANAIHITYQGCAELGICYPPVTKSVDLTTLAVTDEETRNGDSGSVGANWEDAPAESLAAAGEQIAQSGAAAVASEQSGTGTSAWMSGSLVSVLAAFLGFGGLAAGAAGIAKILFLVFLVLAVIALIAGRRVPS